jgi:hypothetical protein
MFDKTLRIGFLMLGLAACKDKGGGDGSAGDGGASDTGSTTDGGGTDSGSGDGGGTDSGSGDGGSGDSGGGDTGPLPYELQEGWGALLDGPPCILGARLSVRSSNDQLGIEVDVESLLEEACADEKRLASTRKPAEAFVLLRGTKISHEICVLPEGTKSEATIAEEYRLTTGSVQIDVAATEEWCLDPSAVAMGTGHAVFTDVLATTTTGTPAMGELEVGPVVFNTSAPDPK